MSESIKVELRRKFGLLHSLRAVYFWAVLYEYNSRYRLELFKTLLTLMTIFRLRNSLIKVIFSSANAQETMKVVSKKY